MCEGNYSGKCLSDPSLCSPAGLTVSFWMKMEGIGHFADPSTNPEGLGYILSSGAQAPNGRGFSVTYDGESVTTRAVSTNMEWEASFDIDDFQGRNWTNFALTWSTSSGLEVLLDGELMATDPMGTPLSGSTVDVHTVVHLGKRNDQASGYLGGSFDDVAIWIYTISYEDTYGIDQLLGDLGLDSVLLTDDFGALLSSEPTTGKKECRVLHEADCARTLVELESIANEELFFGQSAEMSMRGRLHHLAESQQTLTPDDLRAAVNVAAILSLVVEPFDNETAASNAILTNPGSTALVHTMEDFILEASKSMDTSPTFVGCQDFYETSTIGNEGVITLSIYDTLDDVIPHNTSQNFVSSTESQPWVNSRVVSVSVSPSLRKELYNPISIVFIHTSGVSDESTFTPVCAFWNYYIPDTNGGSWDRTGCETTAFNRTHTICECTHFTNFAVVMEPAPLPPPDTVKVVFNWTSRGLAGISAAFLGLLVCLFLCCMRLRTLRHIIHVNVAIATMLSAVCLCLATGEWPGPTCRLLGALLEYSALAVVFWLFVDAVQVLTEVEFGYVGADAVLSSCPMPNRFYGFMFIGWCLPALVTGITVALDTIGIRKLDCGL
ncbi:adhesion G-protein coupled receptor D1-like [Diadema setosum]|uniref:adhesion G-protein coupled receptor D1-like n=1 Tax=Diadema setosum TaxID=31175 RepID=UPI003B3ADCF2